MKRHFLFFVLAVFVFLLTLSTASAQMPKMPVKKLPSTPSSSPSSMPSPGSFPILQVKTPASGENWSLGSKYDITWTSSNISGNLRLDLYCDLPSPHKVGTITANTAVSTGKYNWEAGKYLGGSVSTHGKGYRIVLTADNPSLTKSSPQFNLTVASAKSLPSSATVPMGMKGISFIYPRRGDGFHKGIIYTISWHSINLKDAKLKIELLDNKEQNVLQTIANNIDNKGNQTWTVPMTLPDEATFYKIRIQTMDGAQKATVGPIKIFKGPVLPASLKVTNPLSGDRTFGDIIPVRWTSTAACSGNGGPLDAGFFVELWNEYGTAKVADLTDVGYVFDNESPAGNLNWHWDWNIERGAFVTGTYTIKVRSMISPNACNGLSAKFRIVDPESIKEATLPASYVNKKHCHAERYDTGDEKPTCPQFEEVPPGVGRVGSLSTYQDLAGFVAAGENERTYTILRSQMYFPGLSFQHIRNRIVKKATLNLVNTWTGGTGGYNGFCAGHLYILNGNWNKCEDMPVRPGFDVSISNSQTNVSINVTSIAKEWVSGSSPAYGFLLTNFAVLPVNACDSSCQNRCWSYYKAELKLEFE